MSNLSKKIIYYSETPHINIGKNKGNAESNLPLNQSKSFQVALNSNIATKEMNEIGQSNALQLPNERNAIEEKEQEHSCLYCSKTFTNRKALGGHQNAHKFERSLERVQIWEFHHSGMNQDASYTNPLGATINDRSYIDSLGVMADDKSYIDPFYPFPSFINQQTPNLNPLMNVSAPCPQIQQHEPHAKPSLPETLFTSQNLQPTDNVYRSPSPRVKSPRFTPYYSRPEKGKSLSKCTNRGKSAWNDLPGEKPEGEDCGLDLTLTL